VPPGGGALTMRHRAWADSISLNAIAMPAALEPGPFVTRWVMGRQRGVELVTAVGHVDGLPELRHGPLEPHLPDVAPRTRDVGPDLNLHAKVKAAGGVELFPSVLAKPLHVLSPMLLSIDTSTARQ